MQRSFQHRVVIPNSIRKTINYTVVVRVATDQAAYKFRPSVQTILQNNLILCCSSGRHQQTLFLMRNGISVTFHTIAPQPPLSQAVRLNVRSQVYAPSLARLPVMRPFTIPPGLTSPEIHSTLKSFGAVMTHCLPTGADFAWRNFDHYL